MQHKLKCDNCRKSFYRDRPKRGWYSFCSLTCSSKSKFRKDIKCSFCSSFVSLIGLKEHQRTCLSNPVRKKERTRICVNVHCRKEFLIPPSGGNLKQTTCSKSCANSVFRSKSDNPNWKNSAYITTCFMYHDKKCVVCGEENIVAVHHFDENKKNNDPRNLIPLCPTHHHYCHSRYKILVIKKIKSYIVKFKKKYKNVKFN